MIISILLALAEWLDSTSENASRKDWGGIWALRPCHATRQAVMRDAVAATEEEKEADIDYVSVERTNTSITTCDQETSSKNMIKMSEEENVAKRS